MARAPAPFLTAALSLALVGVALPSRGQPPARARAGANARLAEAVRACAPGEPFASCGSALDAAQAPAIEGAPSGPTRRVIALRPPWLVLHVDASAAGVVTGLHLEGTQRPGAARRRLLGQLQHALAGVGMQAEAAPGSACLGAGPAWYVDAAAYQTHAPRVQLTVEPIADLAVLGGAPERAFVAGEGPGQTVHLCFAGAPTGAADRHAAALRTFLTSTLF